MSNPQDPYGHPDPYGQQGQPGYEQYPQQGYQYGQQGYPQSGGYAAPKAPRKPLDLAALVTIAGWVVIGLFALEFLYGLTQDDFGGDFGDRFFGALSGLGTGIFYGSVLLAVGVWLRKQQAGTD